MQKFLPGEEPNTGELDFVIHGRFARRSVRTWPRNIPNAFILYACNMQERSHALLYTLRTFPLHRALITVKAVARARYIRYPAVSCLT